MSNRQDQPRFSLPVRVYYEDTDLNSVVFYANYIKFMERARTEWLRSLGIELDVLRRREGMLFAVQRMETEFLRPAFFNDLLTVTVALRGSGGASLDFVQEVRREADAACCCRGRTKVICVDEKTLRPKRLPKTLLAEIADGH